MNLNRFEIINYQRRYTLSDFKLFERNNHVSSIRDPGETITVASAVVPVASRICSTR